MLKKILAVVVAFPLVLLVAIGVSALIAWPVQLLFNYLFAGFIGAVSFKQAWAFSVLCRLLFKSSK